MIFVADGEVCRMIELKPCPFCGGEPTMRSLAETANYEATNYILCLNDNCSVKPSMMKTYSTMEEAIEAWNRRVNE